jgi:hypothetical protein
VFLKVEGSWLYSVRLRKLRRRGVHDPLLYLLRVWQFTLNECKETAPVIDEESLAMLEETVLWDGEDGELIASLRAVGFLDGNRLALWWEDAAEALNERRRKDRERQRKSRDKSRVTEHQKPVTPPVVTRDKPVVTVTPPGQGLQRREEKRREEDAPRQTLHVHTNTPGPVIDEFVEVWQLREVESSRQHKFADRGFFGNRGPFAIKETLIGHRDRRGPADKVETALATFWHWWDTAAKKIKGSGWRPSPMDFEQTLEVYLVERGMLSMADWLVQLNKAYST